MSTDTNTTKSPETATSATPASFRFRDENGKMISKEVAIENRWARKEDGAPTKIYQHRLVVREALKAGLPVPKRAKKSYVAGSQSHNDIPSPFDLLRRSGYGVIWQVLAENVGMFVTPEVLTVEVNTRLKEQAGEWYASRYSDAVPYDVVANAYVMTRAPYNAKIEAMAQRVVQDDGGFMLMVNVTEARQLKKRGRKLGSKNKVKEVVVAETPAVVVDADTAVTVTDVVSEVVTPAV